MTSQDIVAMRGGHKVAVAATAYTNTDYHFYGFIPHDDLTITNLKMGDTDLTSSVSGVTYKAGIYYGLPREVNGGIGTEITVASNNAVLVLAQYSPKHY